MTPEKKLKHSSPMTEERTKVKKEKKAVAAPVLMIGDTEILNPSAHFAPEEEEEKAAPPKRSRKMTAKAAEAARNRA